MPIKVVPCSREGRYCLVAEGHVGYVDIREHLNHERDTGYLAHPEFIDATGVALVLTSSEVRKVIEQVSTIGKGHPLGPTAVLVASDFAFGMMRMLEMLIEEVCDVRPFRDRLEADAWLEATPVRMPAAGTG